MKLFGFEIHRIKPEELAQQVHTHKELGLAASTYQPLQGQYFNCNVRFFKEVIWPSRPLDGFARVKYDKTLVDFANELKRGGGRFDVCVINYLHELNCFQFTEETRKIRDKLRILHCVNYANIPPDVLSQIPAMLSAIFTEGKSMKDVPQLATPPLLISTEPI